MIRHIKHASVVPDRPIVWMQGEAKTPLDVFTKKSRATPKRVIEAERRRLAEYRELIGDDP